MWASLYVVVDHRLILTLSYDMFQAGIAVLRPPSWSVTVNKAASYLSVGLSGCQAEVANSRLTVSI